MRALHLVQRRQVVGVEDLQHLRQRHATGRRRRCGRYLPVVVLEPERFALAHGVASQLLRRPLSALGLTPASRGFALVEPVEALRSQALQRARQVGLPGNIAFLDRPAIRQEHGARALVALHFAARLVAARHARIDREALARRADRRCQRGLQRQLAVLRRQVDERSRQARNAGRPRTARRGRG